MKRIGSIVLGISTASAVTLATVTASSNQASTAAAMSSAPSGKTFTLFVYETQESFRVRTDPNASAAYWAAFAEYGNDLAAAGVLRGGGAVVEIGAGRRIAMKDGMISTSPITPDASGLELGGSFIIEVVNMAAAEAWAAKCPTASTGAVVIRENVPMSAAMGAPATPGTTAPQGEAK